MSGNCSTMVSVEVNRCGANTAVMPTVTAAAPNQSALWVEGLPAARFHPGVSSRYEEECYSRRSQPPVIRAGDTPAMSTPHVE
nr:hypothetical protein [Arthrobacter polaris]UIK88265.1 hypothetical protein J0916_12720 [Arthrobacter polaris]